MKPYLYIFIGLWLLLSGGVVFLNYQVDPFGVWRQYDKPLNAFSAGNLSYARLAKAHWISYQQPDLVLLGNSHAASAFQASQFQGHMGVENPFSLAMVGASVAEMERNMRHAFYASGARRFLVVTDLLNFQEGNANAGNNFEVALALDDSLSSRYFAWRNFPATNYSWTVTFRSLQTLRDGYLDTITPQGFVKSCKSDVRGATQSMLLNSARLRLQKFQANPYLGQDNRATWRASLDSLMHFIAQEKLDVTFLVPPFHLSYYYALEAAGIWPKHQQVLQLLVESIAEAGIEPHTRLIDFTSFNDFTGEFQSDPAARIDYWQDADHFNCALADLLIQRTAELTKTIQAPAAGGTDALGARVTAGNLAEHRRRLDARLQDWKTANPKADAYWTQRLQSQP